MDPSLFADHRTRIQTSLGEAVLVAFSARESVRNNDVHHPFRQDSDFYYLTGIEEPDCALVLSQEAATIFVRPRDPKREIWDGPRVGVEGAKAQLNAAASHPFAELDDRLPELLKGHKRVYHALSGHGEDDARLLRAVRGAQQLTRRGGVAPHEVHDSALLVHEARRIKTAPEVALMQQAADISVEAHLLAMRAARPGLGEYQLQALIEHHFLNRGARRPAYQTIVGSGPNATILHYIDNNKVLAAGELVLIDAGCEFSYYAADITRTFPVGGQFTTAQRAIYDVVAGAQQAAIAKAVPGATAMDIHLAAVEVLTQGLLDLDLLQGSLAEALETKAYQPYYMHSTGHLLGMDVHDVGRTHDGDAPRALLPGCVVTVEPGLYFSDSPDTPETYRGIGIRIEDDILITEDGHRNLTAALPTAARDIEQACSN